MRCGVTTLSVPLDVIVYIILSIVICNDLSRGISNEIVVIQR